MTVQKHRTKKPPKLAPIKLEVKKGKDCSHLFIKKLTCGCFWCMDCKLIQISGFSCQFAHGRGQKTESFPDSYGNWIARH